MRKLTIAALAGLLAVAALAQAKVTDYQIPTIAQVHQPDVGMATMTEPVICQACALLDAKPFALMHEHQKVLERNKGDGWEDRAPSSGQSQSTAMYCSMIINGMGSGAIARMCADAAALNSYHAANLPTAKSAKEVAAYAAFIVASDKAALFGASHYLRRSNTNFALSTFNDNLGIEHILSC